MAKGRREGKIIGRGEGGEARKGGSKDEEMRNEKVGKDE